MVSCCMKQMLCKVCQCFRFHTRRPKPDAVDDKHAQAQDVQYEGNGMLSRKCGICCAQALQLLKSVP